MKKYILIIAFLLPVLGVFAQDNVVKFGFEGLTYGQINLKYERVFNESQSLNVQAGVLIPKHIPYNLEFYTGVRIIDDKITGFAFKPEYRFYGKKKDAPEGFYIAPSLILSTYSIQGGHNYEGAMTENELRMSVVGAGVQFGYQWVLGNVTIDWGFAGLSVNRIVFSGKSECEDNSIDYQGVKADIDEYLPNIPFYGDKINISAESDYLKVKAPFILPYYLATFSIGYAF